jgi:hypothetical protein
MKFSKPVTKNEQKGIREVINVRAYGLWETEEQEL